MGTPEKQKEIQENKTKFELQAKKVESIKEEDEDALANKNEEEDS